MPVKNCSVCNQLHQIKVEDWKYLDKDGDHICSPDCLTEWVQRHEEFTTPLVKMDNVEFHVGPSNIAFKSEFEWDVAQHFMYAGIHALYERYIFYWEGKSYNPDFTFPDHGCIVEVKGPWGPSQRSKYRSFREHWNLPMVVVPWAISNQFRI